MNKPHPSCPDRCRSSRRTSGTWSTCGTAFASTSPAPRRCFAPTPRSLPPGRPCPSPPFRFSTSSARRRTREGHALPRSPPEEREKRFQKSWKINRKLIIAWPVCLFEIKVMRHNTQTSSHLQELLDGQRTARSATELRQPLPRRLLRNAGDARYVFVVAVEVVEACGNEECCGSQAGGPAPRGDPVLLHPLHQPHRRGFHFGCLVAKLHLAGEALDVEAGVCGEGKGTSLIGRLESFMIAYKGKFCERLGGHFYSFSCQLQVPLFLTTNYGFPTDALITHSFVHILVSVRLRGKRCHQ